MTKDQRKKLHSVTAGVLAARVEIRDAVDMLCTAADACKGDPMEDRINSWINDLEDMNIELKQKLNDWKADLQYGPEIPESWKEAM